MQPQFWQQNHIPIREVVDSLHGARADAANSVLYGEAQSANFVKENTVLLQDFLVYRAVFDAFRQAGISHNCVTDMLRAVGVKPRNSDKASTESAISRTAQVAQLFIRHDLLEQSWLEKTARDNIARKNQQRRTKIAVEQANRIEALKEDIRQAALYRNNAVGHQKPDDSVLSLVDTFGSEDSVLAAYNSLEAHWSPKFPDLGFGGRFKVSDNGHMAIFDVHLNEIIATFKILEDIESSFLLAKVITKNPLNEDAVCEQWKPAPYNLLIQGKLFQKTQARALSFILMFLGAPLWLAPAKFEAWARNDKENVLSRTWAILKCMATSSSTKFSFADGHVGWLTSRSEFLRWVTDAQDRNYRKKKKMKRVVLFKNVKTDVYQAGIVVSEAENSDYNPFISAYLPSKDVFSNAFWTDSRTQKAAKLVNTFFNNSEEGFLEADPAPRESDAPDPFFRQTVRNGSNTIVQTPDFRVLDFV